LVYDTGGCRWLQADGIDSQQALVLEERMKKLSVALVLSMSLFAGRAFSDTPEEIWKAKCKACHGEDGRAQTKTGKKEKIPDFTKPQWQVKHPDDEIRHTIADGSDENAKMKPFKDKLSGEEIDSLVKYIRIFKKK
jgi:cytochrome c553